MDLQADVKAYLQTLTHGGTTGSLDGKPPAQLG